MATLVQSPKTLTIRGLDVFVKIRFVLIGMTTIALGVFLGYLIDSPEAAELIVSIIVVLALMVIVVKNPLNGLLVWLFFMAFLETWINIPLSAGIPDLSYSRFIIAFLAIFMLAKAATGKFRFTRISLADMCIIATTIGLTLAAPLSVHPKGVIQTTIALHFTPLSLYFFAKNLVQGKRDLQKLFLTIALFGFVAAAYAAYEHATGNVLFLEKGEEVGWLLRRGTDIRMIEGLMGGTGAMGRVLAVVIPVTFYLFLEHKKNDLRRFLLAGMLAVQFYGLVIAMSRTPWYALLLALFVMQFFYPQFRKVFFIIALLAAIVLFVTWDQVSQSQAAGRVNDNVSTLEGREARWQAGYNMWRVKPIQGWGFGRYEKESGRFRTDGERRNFRAIENDYLHILVGSGLIGFLPYLAFLTAPLVNSLRLFFRARAPGWSGFIKPETLTVYWAVFLCLTITSYTAKHTRPEIKMIAFAVAGAVVGSHEALLRHLKTRKPPSPSLSRLQLPQKERRVDLYETPNHRTGRRDLDSH